MLPSCTPGHVIEQIAGHGVKVERPGDEARHLLAGHRKPRAVGAVVETLGDPGRCQPVDVVFMDVALVVGEEVLDPSGRSKARARKEAIWSRVTESATQ